MVQYLVIGVRCWLIVVFLVSSVTKVAGRAAFNGFARSVRDLDVLPASLVAPVAAAVTAGETAAWLLLAVPVPPVARAGCVLATGLLVTFTVTVLLALRRGTKASCRCFGASAAPLGIRHVARNACLAVLATGAAVLATTTGPLSPVGVTTAVCAGLTGGALTTRLDDILDLFQPLGVR